MLGLEHPNILPLLDAGEAQELPFYVARYVRGGSLRRRMNEERRFGLPAAVAILRQAAAALAYAHGHRILHCDVKPGDRLLYLNNDPFSGVIVGTVPGSMTQAFKDAFKFLYDNWSAGVTLTIPVGDMVNRANYNYAKLDLQQSQARVKNQEQQITLEVNDAVLTLETAAKSVQANKIARELAEKQLEAEMKKLNVGLSTNYFVLQYQNDLANRRSLELLALVQYNIALANIAKVTGTTLEARNITLSDYVK